MEKLIPREMNKRSQTTRNINKLEKKERTNYSFAENNHIVCGCQARMSQGNRTTTEHTDIKAIIERQTHPRSPSTWWSRRTQEGNNESQQLSEHNRTTTKKRLFSCVYSKKNCSGTNSSWQWSSCCMRNKKRGQVWILATKQENEHKHVGKHYVMRRRFSVGLSTGTPIHTNKKSYGIGEQWDRHGMKIDNSTNKQTDKKRIDFIWLLNKLKPKQTKQNES